jgi:WD40 repeat protein
LAAAILLACAVIGPLAWAVPIPDLPLPDQLVIWSVSLKQNDNSSLAATAGVWTPDGKHVLTAGCVKPVGLATAGEVRVWDAATGRHVRSFRGSATNYASRAGHLAVSPDGKSVAAGGYSNMADGTPGEFFVEVWDWDREKPRLKLGGFQIYVSGVAFSPDGKVLAAIDTSGTLQAWEVGTGKRLYQSAVKSGQMWGLAWHPKHAVLTAADNDGTAWFFDAVTGAALDEPKLNVPSGFLSAAFAPDGRSVAYGALHGKESVPLRVYDVKTTKPGGLTCDEPRFPPNNLPDVGCVYQVAFSPDGKHLAAACQDKTVRVFDPATGEQTAVALEHKDFVYSVAFSPDGKRLLSVGRDSVKVWTVSELLKRMPK